MKTYTYDPMSQEDASNNGSLHRFLLYKNMENYPLITLTSPFYLEHEYPYILIYILFDPAHM